MSHDLRVTGFVRDDGACGMYRVKQPLTLCEEMGYCKTELIGGSDPPNVAVDKLAGAHVVVIPRPYDDMMRGMMERMQKAGAKVVVEHDDNMFDISPWSVHYQEFGTEDVKVNLNGEIKPLWRNGVNIDLRENRERLDGFKRAVEMADMVTVTQPILADIYRQYNDNIVCLPNCCDSRIWQPLPLREHDTIRIMWSGGSSHYQDVYILKDVLPEICRKYPEVQIVVMGCQWPALFKDIPADRFEFHDWVPVDAYPYKQAALDIDISLIPLEDNRFNRCKSHIKLVEQSFLGVPSVTSYVSPYREFYEGNNMVMVDNDAESWIEGISRLIEDKQLRVSIGRAAKKAAQGKFEARSAARLWADVYAKLAGC